MSADCSYCGKRADLLFQARDENKKISRENFNYYRCASCGMIFLKTPPKNLGDYYPIDYHAIPQSLADLARQSQHEVFKVDLVKQFKTKGKLLEIGPSYGNFAYLAKEAGFEVECIERSKACCEFLRHTVGVSAIESEDIFQALTVDKLYDVIVLWHVFEHLPNTWETFDFLAKHLSPGGCLILAVPNPESLQFKILKKHWAHLDAPRHLNLVPARLLEDRGKRFGLHRIFLTTKDRGSIGWNSFGWQVSLMNPFRHPILRWCMKVVGKLLSIALSPVERRVLLGSAYTLVLQKEAVQR